MYFSGKTPHDLWRPGSRLASTRFRRGLSATGCRIFATVTAIWSAMSVRARDGCENQGAIRGAGILLTLLLTVTLDWPCWCIGRPCRKPRWQMPWGGTTGITSQVRSPVASAGAGGSAKSRPQPPKRGDPVVDQVRNGARGQNGVPGVVLRPRPTPVPAAQVDCAGADFGFRRGAAGDPFTGEIPTVRTSSGSLPKGAMVETGTPLGGVYGTTNGGPMGDSGGETFDPRLTLRIAARWGWR